MASVTKNDGKNAMAEEAESTGPLKKQDAGESGGNRPPKFEPPIRPPGGGGGGSTRAASNDGRGFFTIYKKGQGYWTRIGTVAGSVLIALLTSEFLYTNGRVWFQKTVNGVTSPNIPVVLSIVGAFLAIFTVVVYRIINRPNVVDFLIATDSEMKKVNWTTRAELIGSTKVVIIFMFLIGLLLFLFDIIFGFLFGPHMLHILESPF